MKRKVLVAAALLLSVAVLLWANVAKLEGTPTAGKGATQGPAGAPLVKVQPAQQGNLRQEVLAPGFLEANTVHEIRAPFSSTSVTLRVGIGDRVEAGQVVAELDADDLAVQVAAQEAQVVRAEASLASLRLQQQQSPLQLSQRIEQARAQLLQAQDGLDTVLRQDDNLRSRLDQARANLAAVQSRSDAGAAQLEAARKALLKAEEAYRADPTDPALADAYQQAKASYDTALAQSQEAAAQAAGQLRAAYDELEAAEAEYAGVSGENPVSVEIARSQVEAARLALSMAEMEAESGGTLVEQVRAAETELSAARATLEKLREKLAQAQLKAPAAGTVLAVAVEDGVPAQEAQLLLTIGELGLLKVTAEVDELDIVKVKPDQHLSLKTNATPGEQFEGVVRRVAAQATTAGDSSYFAVEGEVANRDGLLRAGMNAEVTIATAEREGVIVIPVAAVREEDEGASVLVVEEFTVKVRPVEIGLRTETEVEVRAGLQEGEQVVVSPFTLINSLEDGAPVRVEQVSEAEGEAE